MVIRRTALHSGYLGLLSEEGRDKLR